MKRRVTKVVNLGLLSALVVAATVAPSSHAATPNTTSQIEVWTVNTALHSFPPNGPCASLLSCNFGNFSDYVKNVTYCPDVVLAQETRKGEDADKVVSELNQVPNCGTYDRYFYPDDTRSKTAVVWRKAKLSMDGTASTATYAYREKLATTSGSCTKTTDGNGDPTRYVVAVRLKRANSTETMIAASVHWDGEAAGCWYNHNFKNFLSGARSKLGTAPLVVGGDHNRKASADASTVAAERKETTKATWYNDMIANGYRDAIGGRYGILDTNGNGYPDICEHWTKGSLPSTAVQIGVTSEDDCNTAEHSRIDFLWVSSGSALWLSSTTHRGYAGTRTTGNFYSDHRAVSGVLVRPIPL